MARWSRCATSTATSASSWAARAGRRQHADPLAGKSLAGEIVIAPPSALADRWSRRLADPVTAFASGWMRVKARARQRGVELPLVISDHVDWPDLMTTIEETGAEEIWVTHGREEAVVRAVTLMGRRARALALLGGRTRRNDGAVIPAEASSASARVSSRVPGPKRVLRTTAGSRHSFACGSFVEDDGVP